MLERILQTFDLTRRPFGAMPDPNCVFITDAIQSTLNELRQTIEGGQGICTLTGDAGIGKSVLCERLAVDLRESFQVVHLKHARFQTSRAVLQEILNALNIKFEGLDDTELRITLRRHIQAISQQYSAVVLIIDEAENFPTEALEELRELTDIAINGTSLVRLLLCGQWRLEERLTEREFDAINQRIVLHTSLQPLSLGESCEYLRFRLQWAGGRPDSIFTDASLQLIARAAAGLPRCLNLLADHCLLIALREQQRPVETEIVRRALSDMKQLPLQWNDLHDLAEFTSNTTELDIELFEDDRTESSDFNITTASEQRDGIIDLSAQMTKAIPISNNEWNSAATVFEFGAESSEFESESLTQSDVQQPCPAPAALVSEPSMEATPDLVNDQANGCCFTITAPASRRATSVVRSAAIEITELTDAAHNDTCLSEPIENMDVPDAIHNEPNPSNDFDTAINISSTKLNIRVQDVESPQHNTTTSSEEHTVPKFVEEIVLDHYAALQEPEFSGIIWNLARQSQESMPDVEEQTAVTAVVAPQAVTSENNNIKSKSTRHISPQQADALIDEPPQMTLDFGTAQRKQKSKPSAPSVNTRLAINEDDNDDEMPTEHGGYIEDIRQPHPNLYLDAIIPLINDVIDPEGEQLLPESSARTRDEIEAELLDVLTSGELGQEEMIGSEVLDLCLDAQAAIRKAQDAVAKSLRDQLAAIDNDDELEEREFGNRIHARFDTVEPDEQPVMNCLPKSEFRSVERQDAASPSERSETPHETARRPFSRLFSELRRRQRLVG